MYPSFISSSLITVNLNENFIDSHNKSDEMPELSKAYNFLIKRKATMKILGLEDRMYDKTPIEKLLFRSEYIENTISSMIQLFEGNIDENIDANDVDVSGFNIEPITPSILFENLRKPLEEVYLEKCSYKGKITPFFYCKATELEDPTDLYAVDSFIMKLFGTNTLQSGDQRLLDAIESLVAKWMNSDKTNKHFGFIDLNKISHREELDPNIKEALMIGKKGRIHNAEMKDLVQPEREKISNKQYPSWFEDLYEKMSQKNDLGECNMGSVEEKSRLNMYRYIGEWLNKFYSEIERDRDRGAFQYQYTIRGVRCNISIPHF
ncbi:hypothetical protein JYU34_000661 [Plutella xylostella]|uniref:Uncharacterized protein n=1 Tax=Plutella xylostella TaxID=51655 RepID=A0ABQ7PP13_PLUXY|nr:hypothetical protein JYU34_022908 [Plutella xylostella]KAG7313519.1 hypothetical protein JYU34_000661 [Plutella xylostella]